MTTPSPGEVRIERARANRLKAHVLNNIEARARGDLMEQEHVSSRVPAHMLLSLVAEVREARGLIHEGTALEQITVGDVIAYLRDNYTPDQPVVLTETADTPDGAVVLTDVIQGIREG